MDCFSGQRILITGGAGFVGSRLVLKLLALEPKELIIVDNLLSADLCNVPDHPQITFIQGSIADDRILQRLPADLDYVFHLSTYHGNQSSIHNPIADHEHNLLTTLKLCERMKDTKTLSKIVYASAGCVVAEKTHADAAATDEDAPVSLYHDSPYQISKIVGEFYGNYYFIRHGLPFVKARFQNVYGPGEILGAGQWRGTPATVWRNVTPTFIYKALKGEALQLDNEGQNTRDFIFVDDIVDGLMRCASVGKAGDVYNLASGVETSIRELADAINELTGNRTPSVLLPARTWDRSGKRHGSTEKSADSIGFRAKVTLREGLAETIAWTRANLALIERCIAQHQQHMAA